MSELNAMKQHGVFSWNELMTNDIDAAKGFYGELFGWQLDDLKDSAMDYTMAKVKGTEVAGMMQAPAEAGKMPPMWGAYVTVDDIDKRIKQVESLGGKVLVGPREIPVGRFAVIADPQGAVLSIITYANKD